MDHRSAECIGIHAVRFEAIKPIRQGMRRHCAAFAEGVAHGLVVWHNHSSRYMAEDF